MPFPISRY